MGTDNSREMNAPQPPAKRPSEPERTGGQPVPGAQPSEDAPSPARYRELGDETPAGNYGSPELPQAE